MFQLIVAVVGIALVVAIAVAVIFFGGSVFTTGQDRALYAQLMNHGTQIEGAMKLYQTDYGTFPDGTSAQQLSTLKSPNGSGDTYLSSVPQGDWYINSGVIYRKVVDAEQCKRMNVVAKMPVTDDTPNGGCPSCESPEYSQWPGCTSSLVADNKK